MESTSKPRDVGHRFAHGFQTLCVVVAIIGTGIFVTEFVVGPFFSASNCGGNSAALSACQVYALVIKAWQAEHPNTPLRFDALDPEAQAILADLPGASWVRSAKFLAKMDAVRIDPAGSKQIIIVCDTPFNNVPRHTLWNAPMTHAVGYSTGEVGLISPAEFSQLNLAGLVDLQAMQKNAK